MVCPEKVTHPHSAQLTKTRQTNLILLFSDQPRPDKQACETSDERVHGVLALRAEEDNRGGAGHPQRRDQQEARTQLEVFERTREAALHPGGREVEASSHAGVPWLQIPAKEKAEGFPTKVFHRYTDVAGEQISFESTVKEGAKI